MSYLLEYREAIRKGEIKAGVELITELDNLIADLDDPQYRYDTELSHLIISFIEGCCKLTVAPFYGKPFKLLLWQKAFIEVSFSFQLQSIDNGEWVQRFQEILLLIARKNGKTELIAAILFTLLILGSEGSQIVCSGTNDNIASICYDTIDRMRLLVDPQSVDTWKNQKGIKCKINGNFIFKLCDSTRGKEGRNIDVAGIDEAHELLNDGIYKPIQQSTGVKEQYTIFIFSSEGFTTDGFLDDKLKEYRKILNGEDRAESAKRKLAWLYTQDSEAEVWETNENGINPAWQKSNPSVGAVKKWSYLRDRVDEARKSKTDRAFVLCKDFNFHVSTSTAWLERSDYDYVADFDIEEFRGHFCIGAVDLSKTTDLTAAKIMLRRQGDNRKYVVSHYWTNASKIKDSDDSQAGAKYLEWQQQGLLTICDDNENDLTLVADWFWSFKEKYDIQLLWCGYDQRFKSEWVSRMEYYGWLDGVTKKDDRYNLLLINQSPEVLDNANGQVEADLKARRIVGLNEIDKWCFGNASLKVSGERRSLVVKIDNNPKNKIDGAVCMVILQETFNRYKVDWNDYLK